MRLLVLIINQKIEIGVYDKINQIFLFICSSLNLSLFGLNLLLFINRAICLLQIKIIKSKDLLK